MDLGQHIGQEPTVIHLNKGFAAFPFFQGVENAIVDLFLIERIDFDGGEKRLLIERIGAIALVEAMTRQIGGKFTGVVGELNFDDLEITKLRVLSFA